MNEPLSDDLLRRIDAYWRAANYLSVGQIYLLDNALLKKPLVLSHVKPRLLGHWGTTPGLNFVYVHLNRIIKQYDLNMIYVTGPGHGGPGLVANTYLEGTYSEFYTGITRDERGMNRLFKQFSFPGGIPSHVAAETPGSINEGGELGYSLMHAYGAAFDNPDLIVACVVGDGEAETGPLATSWHSNKFLNPVHDGAVLPILHLNGYKIASPAFLARIPRQELEALFRGYGYPDANTLLATVDHCLRSRHYVNVIVAGKQPQPQWLNIDAAIKHCSAGLDIWAWASNDEGSEPDVVMACAGDVPTLETLAAVDILRAHLPELRIRVINVVDLMALQPRSEHPHGLEDGEFDALFTKDKPIIFAYHGYPWLIHRLTYRRTNHDSLHVRGYKEEGTTTTPFDMTVLNDIDRFHLVNDVINRVPTLGPRAAYLSQFVRDQLIDHERYIRQYGEDMPVIRDWKWGAYAAAAGPAGGKAR